MTSAYGPFVLAPAGSLRRRGTNEPGAVIGYRGTVPPVTLAGSLKEQAPLILAPLGALGHVTPTAAAEELLGPPKPAWFEAVFPWEIPPRWRCIARLRWRRQQLRIWKLERQLGYTDRSWGVPDNPAWKRPFDGEIYT